MNYFRFAAIVYLIVATHPHATTGIPLLVTEGKTIPLTTALDVQSNTNEEATEELLEIQAQNYLLQFGYMIGKSKNSLRPSSSSSEFEEALKRLQRFTGLSETGKIDKETLEMMAKPRCQLPDTNAVRGLRRRRFVTGSKWNTNGLTYDVKSYPTDSYNLQNKAKVDEIIATSIKDWTDATNLNIKRSSSSPMIKLNFYAKDHGDGYPFDGRGRVLAHAFFPPYGQLHFDDDESWSSASFGGPNLRQVATHELGHTLGLEHSSDRKAVMFPYYSYNSNFKLGYDDIAGIRSLYGLPELMIPSPANNIANSITSTSTTTSTTTTIITTTSTTTTTTTTTLPPTTTTTTTTTKPPTTKTTTSTTTSATASTSPTTTPPTTTTTSKTSRTTTTTTTTLTTRIPSTTKTKVIYWWQWWQWQQKELENHY